jgi:UDP-N-acetyl-D-glucosamine dehydrogenase
MNQEEPVGVVGLGYVGLPLALAMVGAGYEVVGVDTDADRVAELEAGRSYVNDVSDANVTDAVGSGLSVTTEYAALGDVSGVSVCVPTPLRKSGTPDLSVVMDAAERLAAAPLTISESSWVMAAWRSLL